MFTALPDHLLCEALYIPQSSKLWLPFRIASGELNKNHYVYALEILILFVWGEGVGIRMSDKLSFTGRVESLRHT